MYYGRSQTGGWNIFARELQNVLRRYNLDLSMLDDRVGIHPEKVRRLTQSLHSSKGFPVLNVDEMDQLITTLNLSEDEITRLRAAILAASVERTLMDRISPDDAREAANQIFPIIFQALEDESESDQGLGNTRGTDIDADDDSGLDEVFGSVFAAIDAGEQALDLGSRMLSAKKSSQLQLAVIHFTQALESLNTLPGDIRRGTAWRYWQHEAQLGLTTAQSLLARL